MRYEEYPVSRYIPMNVVDSGRTFNGLIKTRNLVEACILASPVFLILFFSIPNDDMMLKVQIMSVCVSIPFMAGIIGIPPYSLVEAIQLFIKFRKNSHFALYNPKLKMETVPDFLVHATSIPLFTQLKTSFDMLFGDTSEKKKEEAALTIANCTNEIHYKDSESESEWRKEQRKAEKEVRKKEKKERRESKKRWKAKIKQGIRDRGGES